MFCSKCGKKLPDGASVCPDCGAKVGKDINFSDVTNYAGQKAQQVSSGIQNQVEHFRQTQANEAESRKVSSVGEMFVDPREQKKAVIGEGFLSNMIRSGVLGKGFGVLTDRRLYFRGKCYTKVNSHFIKTDEDRTIDIQDITSSGFSYARNLTWLFLTGISFLAALFFFHMAEEMSYYSDPDGVAMMGILFSAAAVAFLILYIIMKRTIYTVTFAGGSLSIKASSYGVEEVRAFDKALHMEKDRFLEK